MKIATQIQQNAARPPIAGFLEASALLLRSFEFRFNDFLKCRLGLRSAEQYSVNKNSGSAFDACPDAVLNVLLNLFGVLSTGEASVKPLLIELQAAGHFGEATAIEFVGIREQEIMILPKSSLLAGTTRGFSGEFRLRVHTAQWKVSVR